MRFEHKLSPAVVAYAANARQQLTDIRTQYLIGLGIAKENEIRADTVRQALSQQLALIAESEGLPAPVQPYQLSDDGRSLVGEIAESDQQSAISGQPMPAANGQAALLSAES